MCCPETGCYSTRTKTLSASEIARVRKLPPHDDGIAYDLPSVCEDCGALFIEGVVEDLIPLVVKLGHLEPPAKIISFARTS